MIITIDTTQPLTPADRAILTALLSPGPVPVPPAPHTRQAEPPPGTTSPFLARLAEAAQSAKPRGAMAEARLPVTEQAGVRSVPSVEDSDPYADIDDDSA